MSSRIIRGDSAESKNASPYSYVSKVMPESTTALVEETQAPPANQTGDMASPSEPTVESGSPDDADGILREARGRAAGIEKEAYEKGFTEGERAGREVGEKMVEAQLRQYANSLEELNQLRAQIFASSEREVIRLALEVAKKVVKREVRVDGELIVAIVRVALSRLSEKSVVTVRVNPKDCAALEHQTKTLDSSGVLHEGVRVLADETIAQGGCLIETESGIIDARVEEQFKEIEKGFFD